MLKKPHRTAQESAYSFAFFMLSEMFSEFPTKRITMIVFLAEANNMAGVTSIA
jgi:SNF family Na+-dependent transporter